MELLRLSEHVVINIKRVKLKLFVYGHRGQYRYMQVSYIENHYYIEQSPILRAVVIDTTTSYVEGPPLHRTISCIDGHQYVGQSHIENNHYT